MVRDDMSAMFQMKIVLILGCSGGSDDLLFTTANTQQTAEAFSPLIKHMNLIFPFCKIKNNICLQLCYMVVQDIQVCGEANNHIRESSLIVRSQI